MNNSKCPKNQVYNPDTKRCIKKDSKKGIEILFKNKDKEILKSFELINGKIVKKCPKDKIRNPQTLRCIKSKKPTKEPSKKPTKEPTKEQIKDLKKISRSLLLNKRTEAVNKIKNYNKLNLFLELALKYRPVFTDQSIYLLSKLAKVPIVEAMFLCPYDRPAEYSAMNPQGRYSHIHYVKEELPTYQMILDEMNKYN